MPNCILNHAFLEMRIYKNMVAFAVGAFARFLEKLKGLRQKLPRVFVYILFLAHRCSEIAAELSSEKFRVPVWRTYGRRKTS